MARTGFLRRQDANVGGASVSFGDGPLSCGNPLFVGRPRVRIMAVYSAPHDNDMRGTEDYLVPFR